MIVTAHIDKPRKVDRLFGLGEELKNVARSHNYPPNQKTYYFSRLINVR